MKTLEIYKKRLISSMEGEKVRERLLAKLNLAKNLYRINK